MLIAAATGAALMALIRLLRYGLAKDEAEKRIAQWERKATDAWFVKDKAAK